MAEADIAKVPSLSEQYLLEEKEDKVVKKPDSVGSEEVVSQKTEETPVAAVESPVASDAAVVESLPASDAAVLESSAASDAAILESSTASDAAILESTGTSEASAVEDSGASATGTGESTDIAPNAGEGDSVINPGAEESSENTEQEGSGEEAAAEETPEIKLETTPADFRFPTTNQTRHCFTRYIEYHRCVAVKGEGASECDKYSKYYRSLCPGEWIERWNEQRENGTFPGPL